jgi:hypothetical protein
MSGQDQEKAANLEFFETAILKPTLVDFESEQPTIIQAFAVIEAAHWTRLGTHIGYFDEKHGQEIVLSREEVSRALAHLEDSGMLSTPGVWANIIRLGDGGRPVLNQQSFTVSGDAHPQILELLRTTFQLFLLLTAENMLDVNSRFFMDAIGWTQVRLPISLRESQDNRDRTRRLKNLQLRLRSQAAKQWPCSGDRQRPGLVGVDSLPECPFPIETQFSCARSGSRGLWRRNGWIIRRRESLEPRTASRIFPPWHLKRPTASRILAAYGP